MAELVVEAFPVDDLHLYHRNPRRGNVKAIAASLKKRGQYRPIVVNLGSKTGRKNEILAGNHTWAAAKSLGWKTIQATTVDLDDDGAAQIVLADNRLADLGTYDDGDLLATIQDAGDLTGTGYTDQDLTALLRALDEPQGLTDPDDVPDLPDADTITVEGDVWRLGPHVLYVGSSGNIDAVLDAAPASADAIWTDPPYGVSYVGGTGMTIQNDGADEAVQTFADAVATILAVGRPGAPVYVAHADLMRCEFQRVMTEAGMLYRQTLIWVKNALVMGHADYHWQHEAFLEAELAPGEDDHEAIAYGFTPGGEGRLGRGGPRWYGDNKSSTVFQVPKPKANRQHPTMKPVELIERMLRNSVPTGGLVFDPFGGSGSTLIAAHRLGARALLCELDPKYVDVRHAGHVVSKAVVVATGVSAQGRREILGMRIGDSESTYFWTEFLRSLRERGLKVSTDTDPLGVQVVTSDAHQGIKNAVKAILTGASWQRCRVHFARNVTQTLGSTRSKPVNALIATIFAQTTPEAVKDAYHQVVASLTPTFPQIAQMLTDAEVDLTAFADQPRPHWQKIWSNNPIERLNREIKRRTDVVQVFPDDASATRLIGAILQDQNEEWQYGERRYLSETSMRDLTDQLTHPNHPDPTHLLTA